jgi:polyketide synthase PksN
MRDDAFWRDLAAEAGAIATEPGLADSIGSAIPLLDRYAACRLVQALQTHGLFLDCGSRHDEPAIIAALQPAPGMTKLLAACLAVLERQAFLKRDAGGWQALPRVGSAHEEADDLRVVLARNHADKTGIVSAIDGTVPHLPDVFAGRVAPTEIVFPDGATNLVLGYYQGHPMADTANRLCALVVARCVVRMASRAASAPVRLMEAGAGTGTTTVQVMAELAKHSQVVDYLFTDLSAAFVGRAKRQLAATHPALRFARFDLEASASESAPLGAFDIIIAANALHATADLGAALDHLASRLAPGGVLVLNEITTPQDHLTLAFGMLPGWWRATDTRSAAGPLLTAPDWQQRLAPRFDTRVIAGPGPQDNPYQSVIVASLRS